MYSQLRNKKDTNNYTRVYFIMHLASLVKELIHEAKTLKKNLTRERTLWIKCSAADIEMRGQKWCITLIHTKYLLQTHCEKLRSNCYFPAKDLAMAITYARETSQSINAVDPKGVSYRRQE